jgi:hypothetical protein
VILHELSCLVGEHPLFVFIIKVATIPDKHDGAIGCHVLEHFRLVIVIQGNTFSFDYFRFFLEQALEESPTPAEVVDWLEDDLDPKRTWRSVRRQIVRDPANRTLIDRVRAKVPHIAPMLDLLLS